MSLRPPRTCNSSAADVIALYSQLERLGIEIWIDGGWGVDTLLGNQTRPHEDIDIVIQQHQAGDLRKFLEDKGYRDVPRENTSAWNFVMGDESGHLVDFHVINFDQHGNGLNGPIEKEGVYPAESVTGTGTINGHLVRCITAQWMVNFHSGYELDQDDYQDVSSLCEKFNIPLPAEYLRFQSPGS